MRESLRCDRSSIRPFASSRASTFGSAHLCCALGNTRATCRVAPALAINVVLRPSDAGGDAHVDVSIVGRASRNLFACLAVTAPAAHRGFCIARLLARENSQGVYALLARASDVTEMPDFSGTGRRRPPLHSKIGAPIFRHAVPLCMTPLGQLRPSISRLGAQRGPCRTNRRGTSSESRHLWGSATRRGAARGWHAHEQTPLCSLDCGTKDYDVAENTAGDPAPHHG